MRNHKIKGRNRRRLLQWVTIISGVLLLPGLSLAGSYRDKHGNAGTIILGAPTVNLAATGIDYTVPHTVNDSIGSTSGEYVITSETLPGRDPSSDDFVLNVFVSDNVAQTAAELIFRNNTNVAPLAPILRLLDCSGGPCTEDKRYDNAVWGPWVIQDQADIAAYPIELLDTRVITQLLDPAQLSQLPNMTDGNGNWAEIMENHRTNFSESRFRADIDNLGDLQSDLLTSRMIIELDLPTPNTDDDWLDRHNDDRGACNLFNQQTDPGTGFCIGIRHGELTFLTAHRMLIEDMTTELHDNYNWPLDFSFPFGRMPIWLVDPGHDSSDYVSAHLLPLHWDQVKTGQSGLDFPGCWHDFPLDAYTPTLTNGSTNLGQYECTAIPTANGFVDRPCTVPSDYNALGPDMEGAWHNPIHGIIGGSFGAPGTTAGTMVFWAFHTYASTNTLANWRQAQRRDMPVPFANSAPIPDAGGPYAGLPNVAMSLNGSGSTDPELDLLTYSWAVTSGNAANCSFDDDTLENPELTCTVADNYTVTLTADDGQLNASDDASVTVITQAQGIADLDAKLDALVSDGILKEGQANGLSKPLNNALKSLGKGKTADACNQLQDFIDEVYAKTPTPLDAGNANELIDDAHALRASLGCS